MNQRDTDRATRAAVEWEWERLREAMLLRAKRLTPKKNVVNEYGKSLTD